MSEAARVRFPSAASAHPVRVLSFAEAERAVKVKWEASRGWHVELWVKYPGAQKSRRVRVTWAPGIGKVASEDIAERVAHRIRALAEIRPLHEVLREYVQRDVPENFVPYRWEREWLPEVRRRHRTGEISAERRRGFESFAGRGYLRFWSAVSIYQADAGALERWLAWMRDTFPHLRATSLRHIVADFGTFLRWEKRIGTIPAAPELPTIRVQKEKRKVPTRTALRRILDAIPEARRGLWLARAQAGLRPAEARRLNVAHYRDGALHLPAAIVKTREERILRIVDVAPELDAWIRAHRAGATPWEPLFVNPTSRYPDKRWGRFAEQVCWQNACRDAGVEYIAPNRGGRHAFATFEAKGGTNLLALQKWLGHSQFKTTEGYIADWDAVELASLMRPVKKKDDERKDKIG